MESQEVGEKENISKIGTNNFVRYLEGATRTNEGVIRAGFEDFEKQIELPEEIHQTIKEMYEQGRTETFTLGPHTLKSREAFAQNVDAMMPGAKDLIINKPGKKVEVEQARVVYVDIKNRDIKSTLSEYGLEEEVSLNGPFKEVFTNKGYPLIAVHTHPRDANLSFSDYGSLLLGEPHQKMRVVNSVLVLCPGVQIMAIATKDTPIYTVEQKKDLLMKRTNTMNERNDKKLLELIKSLQNLSARKTKIDALNTLKATADEKFAGFINEEIERKGIKEGESEEIPKKIEEMTKTTFDEGPRAINSDLIAFAREMNVKLFFSQDMRTFKEFSA